MEPNEPAGSRDQLPDGAAPLVDLAARWMRQAGLTGPLTGGSIEFTFDQHARVDGFYVKTRGGRHELEPADRVGPSAYDAALSFSRPSR